MLSSIKISVKIVALVVMMGLVAIATAIYAAHVLGVSDASYQELLQTDSEARVALARANRNLNRMGYALYRTTAYAGASQEARDAAAIVESSFAEALAKLDIASQLTPENTQTIEEIKRGMTSVKSKIDTSIKLGLADENDKAQAYNIEVDAAIVELNKKLTDLVDLAGTRVEAQTHDIADGTHSASLTMMLGGLLAIVLGVSLSLFVASKGITGPLDRLRLRMAALASGNSEAAVDGLTRGDEIGAMAQAVEVFRQNAIDQTRLERESARQRTLSDEERAEREAQKMREAADIQFAVDNLAAALAKLAQGDVAYRIDAAFIGTLDGVRHDFNRSAETLQAALRTVAENARGIDSGANEIRGAADDLARRTEQQAAAVEETAAALEQITTTVRDASRRAREAGELVSRAKAGAEQSGEVVREATRAMEQIAQSANEISSIIGVIDEIAFQTNLLALNAGVEAARAGEAGKGFAVVAQEVRELAQRSAKAAKEIKALINTSNTQVAQGVKLVGDTGQALHVIVDEVQEINRHVAAIVESAQEQSSGLQQINMAVNQLDQDTQKNAAMVEETTAASHKMAEEAASLNQLIAAFKLSGGSSAHIGSVASVARPAPAAYRPAEAPRKPAASPVHALGRKIASAFSGNAALETSKDAWQEF
ncbi:chemotaxis protein [Xaviernesmea oryzae]|uniref:Chemotaxis protein n=1 Tax=Xaviernesmea oryzae TaxID=464029 RepID=A0A1Q9B1B1_9HYPH|nr:HAMP domain-containing methyl-accepting chemotaxis protein [Xaviernesmea oryzae]OLP61790.1 chemotaxis protein [Xaviernesmea oryzae]SEL77291.1 methyl-accepting chemotaxis sensory transducer with TarH sensor [Xaviernesmea oryzae]